MTYTLHGATFNATEEAIGAFTCFDPTRPEATDVGPHGMVEEMKAFLHITEGMTSLIDVGALFGIYSLMFTRNPDARAYAIEASPWAFPILQEQCDLNPGRNIQPVHLLAGSYQHRITHCGRDWKHVAANTFPGDCERVSMEEVAIDNMLFCGRVDCMKIDVEAFECSVLRGAAETIRRDKPVLFLECHCNDLWRDAETPASLLSLLRELGYGRLEYFDGTPVTTLDDVSMTRIVGWCE